MRYLVRSALVLSVLAGVAAAACSSSDDSSGGSAGSAGASSGGTKGGGGTSAGAGTSSAGASDAGASSGGTSGSSAGGAGDSAGAGDSSAGAAGAASLPPCNDLVFTGSKITIANTAGAAPTLAYGTLVAGDYTLTSGAVYQTAAFTEQLGTIAHVAVAGQTATIDIADSAGNTSTLVVVMGQPNTMAPSSVKITCSTDPAFVPTVNVELSAFLSYGVAASTFSIYDAPVKTLEKFTLQP
jgi:hypothetical protein